MPIKIRSVAVLDPNAVDTQTRDAAAALLQEGSSRNTAAAYGSAIKYWAAWFGLRYGQPFALPLAPAVAIQFLVDHVMRSTPQGLACELPPAIDTQLQTMKVKAKPGPLSLNTILHRLSVLSKAHQIHGHDNPCQHPSVRELVAKTRRAYAKRGVVPAKKDALTRDLLEKLLDTCDGSLRGRRDRALLLFAWATGGRRRSEVVHATMENTSQVAQDVYLYTLSHSKTNQGGAVRADDVKPLLGSAAQALTQWLHLSEIHSGPIFRRVRRGDVLGEPLSAAAVREIVQDRCRQAGVQGHFSAHSLRSGFVTEAGRQNIPLGETMALSGHASVATVMGYFRAGNALHSGAAKLFDTDQAATSSTSVAIKAPQKA